MATAMVATISNWEMTRTGMLQFLSELKRNQEFTASIAQAQQFFDAFDIWPDGPVIDGAKKLHKDAQALLTDLSEAFQKRLEETGYSFPKGIDGMPSPMCYQGRLTLPPPEGFATLPECLKAFCFKTPDLYVKMVIDPATRNKKKKRKVPGTVLIEKRELSSLHEFLKEDEGGQPLSSSVIADVRIQREPQEKKAIVVRENKEKVDHLRQFCQNRGVEDLYPIFITSRWRFPIDKVTRDERPAVQIPKGISTLRGRPRSFHNGGWADRNRAETNDHPSARPKVGPSATPSARRRHLQILRILYGFTRPTGDNSLPRSLVYAVCHERSAVASRRRIQETKS
jgi:hypothetical protein